MHPLTTGAPALLELQVRVLTSWWTARDRVAARMRDDRGDAYSGTIWTAIGVVAAIVIGGILMAKFQGKAEDIDTNTPTGQLPAP